MIIKLRAKYTNLHSLHKVRYYLYVLWRVTLYLRNFQSITSNHFLSPHYIKQQLLVVNTKSSYIQPLTECAYDNCFQLVKAFTLYFVKALLGYSHSQLKAQCMLEVSSGEVSRLIVIDGGVPKCE